MSDYVYIYIYICIFTYYTVWTIRPRQKQPNRLSRAQSGNESIRIRFTKVRGHFHLDDLWCPRQSFPYIIIIPTTTTTTTVVVVVVVTTITTYKITNHARNIPVHHGGEDPSAGSERGDLARL